MHQQDSHFLRRQAELCTALSRATFDLTVAGRLRAMAEEFRAKASEGDDDDQAVPRHMSGNGASSHDSVKRN